MANSLQKCPKCGVLIEDGAKVLFSAGPPGTRARLWARVCQYVNDPTCINKDDSKIGDVIESDYYD